VWLLLLITCIHILPTVSTSTWPTFSSRLYHPALFSLSSQEACGCFDFVSVSPVKEQRKLNVIYVHAFNTIRQGASGKEDREGDQGCGKMKGGAGEADTISTLPLSFFPIASLDLLIPFPLPSPDCLPLSLSAVAVVFIMGHLSVRCSVSFSSSSP
jgi:hypothetical protein